MLIGCEGHGIFGSIRLTSTFCHHWYIIYGLEFPILQYEMYIFETSNLKILNRIITTFKKLGDYYFFIFFYRTHNIIILRSKRRSKKTQYRPPKGQPRKRDRERVKKIH
jgi:hypothetical protein